MPKIIEHLMIVGHPGHHPWQARDDAHDWRLCNAGGPLLPLVCSVARLLPDSQLGFLQVGYGRIPCRAISSLTCLHAKPGDNLMT